MSEAEQQGQDRPEQDAAWTPVPHLKLPAEVSLQADRADQGAEGAHVEPNGLSADVTDMSDPPSLGGYVQHGNGLEEEEEEHSIGGGLAARDLPGWDDVLDTQATAPAAPATPGAGDADDGLPPAHAVAVQEPPGAPPSDGDDGGGGVGDGGAPDQPMSYTEHLLELRDRLIKAVIALVICIAISFAFTSTIFDILKSRAEGLTLIRTGVAEMLGTYFKVAFISGVVLSTPVWLYQVVAFITPGLTKQEKRFLFLSMPIVVCSFLIGVLFAYFLLLPPALNFLIHFGEDIAIPLIRVGDYVAVVSALLFWIGLVFELPLLIYILARLGVVTPEFLKRNRPYAITGAFLLSAIITPTWDPINQSIVAIPIIVLYEVGILLSHPAYNARQSKE